MSSPRVSILLPTLNAEDSIERSVRSLLNQTYDNFEVFVLDSNSTDKTAQIVNQIDDDRLVFLDCGDRNLPESLNYGARCAGGEYLARQDADDWSDPERIATQVQYLEDHEDVGLVGCFASLVGLTKKPQRWTSLTEPTVDDLQEQMCFMGGALMMRADVFSEVEGYDEHFLIAEDYDIILRIAALTGVRNIPEILYEYTVSTDGLYAGNLSEAKLYHMVARRRSVQGELPNGLLTEVKTTGVECVYEILTDAELSYYHAEMAQESLRFGRLADSRYHSRMALRYDIAVYPLLIFILSLFGNTFVRIFVTQYRRYKNYTQ